MVKKPRENGRISESARRRIGEGEEEEGEGEPREAHIPRGKMRTRMSAADKKVRPSDKKMVGQAHPTDKKMVGQAHPTVAARMVSPP
jgi:hypothetical protein